MSSKSLAYVSHRADFDLDLYRVRGTGMEWYVRGIWLSTEVPSERRAAQARSEGYFSAARRESRRKWLAPPCTRYPVTCTL